MIRVLIADDHGVIRDGLGRLIGALPDMVTFTPDGRKLLVANEGERSDDGTRGAGDDDSDSGLRR